MMSKLGSLPFPIPLALVLLLAACGDRDAPPEPSATRPDAVAAAEVEILDQGGELEGGGGATRLSDLVRAHERVEVAGTLVVDYPLGESVFPPDMVAPTILWHDGSSGADRWLVTIEGRGEAPRILALVPGAPPPSGEVDPRAFGDTNEPYVPTPYQASARSWTPPEAVWDLVKRRHAGASFTLTLHGVTAERPDRPLSEARVALEISEDPVGAPVFYRDVPLMPDKGVRGKIQPLSSLAFPLIGWRLRDLSKPESRLVLEGMMSCGNCHSFSSDGKTFGMDIDGPQGDKGTYAIREVAHEMTIEYEDIITWNSFPEKPEGHKTIGFLSRVAPDGRHVLTTLNEALYVSNFLQHEYLQVFYPTRGILAYYDRATQEMHGLPGANDPAYVHTNGVWSPDGEWIVFSRARARDPYDLGKPLASYPNDPNETQIQYDLYRVPFREGKGGEPERIEGASENGLSNTFPKVSPDGKWIVWTKCRNGQLMRPDGRLWIVPFEGGEARPMRCNTESMNSWHSFAPNSRWMVFSSKVNTPYTQMFLTHIDQDGQDSPAIVVPHSTAANRAVNLPEFINAAPDAIRSIDVPAIRHHVLYWRAMDEIRATRTPEALVLLRQALELDPQFARAHAALGACLISQGDIEVAVRHYERALEIDPRLSHAQNDMGVALEKLGLDERAAQHYLAAIGWDPEAIPQRRNLIRVSLRIGRHEQAAAQLLELLELVPGDEASRWQAIHLLLGLGRADLAFQQLRAQIEHRPDDVKALSLLAWQLATHPQKVLRNGTQALEAAEQAIEVSRGTRPEPLDAMAAALAELGRFEEAVRLLELALARSDLALSPKLRSAMQDRLDRYRTGRPWRGS